MLSSIASFSQKACRIASYEFNLSVNSTTIANANTENRLGFGLGFNYVFRPDKKLNVVSGLEYDRTSIYTKHMITDRPDTYSDQMTYYLNNFSVPLVFRYNFFSNFGFFVEAGAFIDALIFSKMKGNYTAYNHESGVSQSYGYKDASVKNFNYGTSLGIGFAIPVYNHNLLVKCDYKFGFRDIDEYDNNLYNRYVRLSIGFRI